MEGSQLSPNKNRVNLSFDPRLVIVILLAVILAMLLMWRPWSDEPKDSDRTITVTGSATLKAEPDEYVFSPSYEFKNADQATALSELTKKSDGIIAELKKLGVKDSQIKTNANNYGRGIDLPVADDNNTNLYTLNLTITLDDKTIAQKVQDYLVTTTPTGNITPYSDFSETKRKQLENTARDQATKDARTKAEQSAKNAGFALGKVKSFTEGNGFGGPVPYLKGGAVATGANTDTTNLDIHQGENQLDYEVTVVYFIK